MKIPLLLLTLFLTMAGSVRADSYDDLRLRWRGLLVGPSTFSTSDPALAAEVSSLTATANANWSSMDTSPTRTYLWSDLAGTTVSSQVTAAYARLETMAVAYATYGSSLNGSSALLTDLVSALDWMNTNRYNSGTSQYDNWWDWDIGTPLDLNDITTILYDQLTSTQTTAYMAAIDHFTGSPSGTGANLMWTCKVVALRGVIGKDSAKISAAKSALTPLFAYVISSDGFYVDGSFIQHTAHPYNGGYGLSLIEDVIDYLYTYSGSTWAVTTPSSQNVYEWLYASYPPFIYKGEIMGSVRGREISRYDEPPHQKGRDLVAVFLRAAQIASTSDAANYNSLAKYWLNADTTFANVCGGMTIFNTLLAESVVSNASIVAHAEPTGFFAFPNMDRSVHLRPGWGASLAMHSSRIFDFESINQENLHAWHLGDGMLYFHTADENQYGGFFWPDLDPYRPPGTTLEYNTTSPSNAHSGSNFVGGTESWDGAHGVIGMDLAPSGKNLRGRKAWFFFDTEVVCLGAGITDTGGADVETIIENRVLTKPDGSNLITTNVTASTHAPVMETAPTYNYTGVQYMHVAGYAAGEDMAYYFRVPQNFDGKREQRTHAWSEINTDGTRALQTAKSPLNFYTMWFDHGVNPSGASYEYAVLPNMSLAQVQSYNASPQYSLLENTSVAQAVLETTLNAVGAIFWTTASHTVGTGSSAITSSGQAAVFMTNDGSNLTVSVSDPTHANTGTVEIDLGIPGLSVIDQDPTVTVIQTSPTIKFTVAMSGLHGVGQRARFNLNASGLVVVDNANANNSGGSSAASTGTWASSTAVAGYWDTDYQYNSPTGQGSYTFTPNLPAAGTYQVQIRYTQSANRATNVPVDVVGSSGTATTTQDQTIGGSQWITLGSYSFAAGTGGHMTVRTTGTTGVVVADAVRFILQ